MRNGRSVDDSKPHQLTTTPLDHRRTKKARTSSKGKPVVHHARTTLKANSDRARAFSELVFSVSAVFEVVSALGGGEFVDEFSDAVPEGFSGSFGVFSQQCFQFGERQFDRV